MQQSSHAMNNKNCKSGTGAGSSSSCNSGGGSGMLGSDMAGVGKVTGGASEGQRTGFAADGADSEDVCWLCLSAEEEGLGPLVAPCRPTGSAAPPPPAAEAPPAYMRISYNGRSHKIRVRPGPEGTRQFIEDCRQLLNIPPHMEFDVVFHCKEPATQSDLRFRGLDAFDAAVYCASLANHAALQQQQQHQHGLQHEPPQPQQQQHLLTQPPTTPCPLPPPPPPPPRALVRATSEVADELARMAAEAAVAASSAAAAAAEANAAAAALAENVVLYTDYLDTPLNEPQQQQQQQPLQYIRQQLHVLQPQPQLQDGHGGWQPQPPSPEATASMGPGLRTSSNNNGGSSSSSSNRNNEGTSRSRTRSLSVSYSHGRSRRQRRADGLSSNTLQVPRPAASGSDPTPAVFGSYDVGSDVTIGLVSSGGNVGALGTNNTFVGPMHPVGDDNALGESSTVGSGSGNSGSMGSLASGLAAASPALSLSMIAESGAGHQLIHARYSDKPSKVGRKSDDVSEAQGVASWVEEYLMVDQRDTTAQGAAAASPPREAPLPLGAELDDVPLRDLQTVSRGWGSRGRLRSSATARPPMPPTRASKGVAASRLDSLGVPLEADEVELIDDIRGGPRISASGGINEGGGGGSSSGGGSASHAAQAALRVSGTVVNAMVVGLSPWRWFGNGNSSPIGMAPDQGPGPGQFTELDRGLKETGEVVVSAGGGEQPVAAHVDRTVASPSAAPSLEAVHAVRDVLVWRNPWRTSRVFGAGLYMAVCVRQLTKGHELLQPSTAVFALCFLLLLRNVVREAVSTYRRTQQQQQQQQHDQHRQALEDRDADECSPSQALDQEEVERRKAAMLLHQRLEAAFQRAAVGAARYGAALLVLGWALLSGRRAITSALVAALLWLGMVLGELRLISQPTFWLLCYVAAFTIPAAYYRCRHAMDAGVEAALRFVVRVLVSGTRVALVSAAGVAVVLVVVLPLNFVLRMSLATGAAFAVLLWQSELGLRQRLRSGGGTWSGGARVIGQVQGQLPGGGSSGGQLLRGGLHGQVHAD
ncbi:hypothetical protein VOLCADRAFT_89673 [Volvox carteri f. nagariensis]|uniref:Reticulon domain-containing protein n=1 Tax=Volvox carteri f. nagariensis TaxID=3068 RepID=D8TRS3_VOLCA|nr:uncharacterized protein VOLCADRAFT_89673 [Volvox carteri f. nagariensis]EFJ49820.1 hypothetical protein VOLCADRAFT_89673 [Volvox carteri f. nagariensis]|eukprot:XP_002949327.1 hypothetical protein VOLCADRAFT_89673 [Volvox carteri f. nagariensis]